MLQARSISRSDAEAGTSLLRDVSLHLRPGMRWGLCGATGAGKTVLLRSLALLDPTDAGEIHWNGTIVRGKRVPEYRARVVYLHQRPVLLEGTVEANLRWPLKLRQHRRRRFDKDRITAWLRALGREHAFLAKRQSDLSGGELQLSALIRAVQLDPQVLLLDEPTAALDRLTAERVEQFVCDWLADRPTERAYVWVSHDPHQTERTCDVIASMNDGRLEMTNGQ